ncbi:MAG: protein of unknown function ScdA domain protein [Bacillota bacterium]|jgi:regulator of cell morphogenesis and NO signaling|nr:protein of unknown function ScdA domain protein [Bacillota bacterium]
MNTFNSSQQIGEIVNKFPKAAEIFKEYKIDFCCGGDKLLKNVIEKQNLNEKEIMDKINNMYEEFSNSDDKNWVDASLEELVEQIVNKHHAYLWDELPKISKLATTILRVHGEHHPELSKVHKLFHTVKMDLESHLTNEETIQYPAIKRYINSKDEADLDKAIKIIDDLKDEHTGAGDILKQLRVVTNDYEIPKDVCETFILTYAKLQEMESDIFQHIHLENNILFPKLESLKK